MALIYCLLCALSPLAGRNSLFPPCQLWATLSGTPWPAHGDRDDRGSPAAHVQEGRGPGEACEPSWGQSYQGARVALPATPFLRH